MHYNCELTERAVRARHAWLKSEGYLDSQIDQPCSWASCRVGDEVILYARGNDDEPVVLARYDVVGGRLRERLVRTFPESA